MQPSDALWHLLNFFAPAAGVGFSASLMAKLLWRRELKNVSWRRLLLCATAPSALALIAGLLCLGRDGRMASYGAMVLACAAGLWWAGVGKRGG